MFLFLKRCNRLTIFTGGESSKRDCTIVYLHLRGLFYIYPNCLLPKSLLECLVFTSWQWSEWPGMCFLYFFMTIFYFFYLLTHVDNNFNTRLWDYSPSSAEARNMIELAQRDTGNLPVGRDKKRIWQIVNKWNNWICSVKANTRYDFLSLLRSKA